MNTSEKAKRLEELDAEIDQAIRILSVVSDPVNHKNERERLKELQEERVIVEEMPVIKIIKPIDEINVWYNLHCWQCEREFLSKLDGAIIKCRLCGHEETATRILNEFRSRSET
jgi:DNA-directed RNA polymerase subunit RPC12/RpoP